MNFRSSHAWCCKSLLVANGSLCCVSKWSITSSRFPVHLHEAPGQGQEYGRNSHCSKNENGEFYAHKIVKTFVFDFLRVQRVLLTSILVIFTREEDGGGDLFHRQISNRRRLPAACRTSGQLWAALSAHQVARRTLHDGRQHVVETHRTFEQRH